MQLIYVTKVYSKVICRIKLCFKLNAFYALYNSNKQQGEVVFIFFDITGQTLFVCWFRLVCAQPVKEGLLQGSFFALCFVERPQKLQDFLI